MSKNRKQLQCTLECPHCKAAVDVFKVTEIRTPAVPADKSVTWTLERNMQTTLYEREPNNE